MFRHQLGALALIAAFALPLAASAQTAPYPSAPQAPAAQGQQRHHHHHNRYMQAMRGLHLSDTQRQQIAGIVKDARGQNKGADPQTRRANMKALRTQIEGVLTADQRNQLHQNLAQGRRMKPNDPGPQAQPQ